MTKIAYRHEGVGDLAAALARRAAGGRVDITTRYRPRRWEEMVGGSLYWIIAHRLMARSPILAFEEAEQGRTRLWLGAELVPVESRARRAHQGWRYLDPADAPPDLTEGAEALATMPRRMLADLTKLGLV